MLCHSQYFNIKKHTKKYTESNFVFLPIPCNTKIQPKIFNFGPFSSKNFGKKKNPGKPLKRSPPGFDHLVHTYRGPNDQFWGVQMFLVLEIFFFFPKQGIFGAGHIFAIHARAKASRKFEKLIYIPEKIFFSILLYIHAQNNEFLPIRKEHIFPKKNIYLNF